MSLFIELMETVARKLVSVVIAVTVIENKTPKVSDDDEVKKGVF